MNEKGKIIKNTNKWLDIRKTLSKCERRDWIRLIADLYALSKPNKDFLEARFIKNDEVLARYKNIIICFNNHITFCLYSRLKHCIHKCMMIGCPK